MNLRDKCHITCEGVSMLGISDAAESIGFRSTGVKITWEQLRDEMPLPCIVHWNQRHFVVVYKIAKKQDRWSVWVSDPACGLLKYSEEQFKMSWLQINNNISQIVLSGEDETKQTALNKYAEEEFILEESKGIALILEPTPKFYSEKGD